ncbi:DUF5325 family protein [Macrococcoides bohemicum]|uniref:DUF5325 family protein n=1 Tax=Macrococcoides bohemicum TaxID=1903056 RepID=A0A4V3B221_9STAP|nr:MULTISPECIES: DUF5325 family protein [Macrococcus]ATD30734.1 hypothetical protein BHM04_05850 [Macrococcus sp. IME1552]MBC9874206.1 DUF5325 family protein [Macrococcus bohemicus]QRN49546.1 DUF5325 family protein [Macrococcus bohemicus]QYA43285.1 DUF5325 family protein [Macrococcus bohemicus]QYA45658.1 DUF5325 family protein [Macrococcus bohemicus]
MKKSKLPFFLLAIFAVLMLILFSIGLAELNYLLIVISIILFTVTFGYGFTLKSQYRKNDWL